MRRQPIHHSDMFQNRFREQSIEEVLWKPAQVKTSIRCGADADFSDQNGISSFISFPPDCSSVDRVAACTLLLMFSTINRARWKSSSNVRIWGVLDKHFIDRSRVRCRDVIERDRPKLPRRVIQKLCRLSYPMITGLLKRVKYGSDDWAVLPSFEMIPNQPILPCGERHGVNKKKEACSGANWSGRSAAHRAAQANNCRPSELQATRARRRKRTNCWLRFTLVHRGL
jgi:hypothetical protein